MAWDPETAIFPRFQVANLNILLLMQAEISELEEQLKSAADADDNSDGDNRKYSCDWLLMSQKGAKSRQWSLCKALQTKLAEYSIYASTSLYIYILKRLTLVSLDQALAHQILLNNQACPRSYNMTLLQQWLVDVCGGGSQLSGPGSDTWLPPELGGRPISDHLTIAPARIRADKISISVRQYFDKVLMWIPFLTITVSIGIVRGMFC